MSEASGSFDLIAEALKGTGAPVRRRPRASQLFTSPPTPPPAVAMQAPPRKREIDRSRDHSVYAAPHRPVRAHAHSRPDDVATERAARPIVVARPKTPARPRWAIPVMLIGFLVTAALGFGLVMVVR